MPFKIVFFFFQEKLIYQKCVPTLTKIFRLVTRNTLIFLFGLISSTEHRVLKVELICDYSMSVVCLICFK